MGTHLSLPTGESGTLGHRWNGWAKKDSFFFVCFWKALGLNLGKSRDLTLEQNSSMFM